MTIHRRGPVQPEKADDSTPWPITAAGAQPMAGPRRGWPAAIAALALLVSACGTASNNDDASAGAADGDVAGSTVASSADDASVVEPGAGDDDGDGDEVGESAPASGSEPATEEAETENELPEPQVNVPAVEVLDVADGSAINLADELAGEDRAILFWFWAPH